MFSSAHGSSAIYVHILDVQGGLKARGEGRVGINTNILMEFTEGAKRICSRMKIRFHTT